MSKNIVLITDSFPYSPGEEFLETELEYWQKLKNNNITIMPKMETENVRLLSKNILLDTRLNYKQMNKTTYIIKTFFHLSFYKELHFKIFKAPIILKNIIRSVSYFLFFRDILELYIVEHKDEEILFYTYWHGEVSYALQSLTKKFHNIKVVSRTHGYDLYQERREWNYMPLKRQFLTNLTKLYVISNKGREYLHNVYGFDNQIIELSRLGVEDLNIISSPNKNGTLHLVSCSYMVKLKRIDKIIDALVKLSEMKIYKEINWTHIGSGILEEEIKNYAHEKLKKIKNLNYDFKGHIANKDIYKFYAQSKIDIFINVSETEGVPVSIMEAMSCHIPVIAPNIGGVSEMLETGYNGVLLIENCYVEEIVNALVQERLFKSNEIRENSSIIYQKRYNAKTNYINFINSVTGL